MCPQFCDLLVRPLNKCHLAVCLSAPWARGQPEAQQPAEGMRAPWAQPARAPPPAPPGVPRAAAEGMAPSTFEWRGWSFNAPKGPILSTHDADSWTARLGMALPEMVFGENKLEIHNAAQGLEFSFKAYEALDACAREVDVQVSVAQTWQANKEDLPEAQKFDWTYSTKYRGSTFKGGAHWEPESTDDKIDFESLKQRAGEDILWSADVILFEDELHDHGTSKLTVRVRVTQSYFYVLQRAFIRVDDMTIRLRETRLHHVFGREQSLRQYTEREERYGTIRQSCSSKQLAEGMLDDPDLLSPKLPVTLDVTEVSTSTYHCLPIAFCRYLPIHASTCTYIPPPKSTCRYKPLHTSTRC